MTSLPRLLLTMGDVAGVGPEIIVRAWPDLLAHAIPIVVGDTGKLQWAIELLRAEAKVQCINRLAAARPDVRTIPCLDVSNVELDEVPPGRISAAAGRAAYDFLVSAIELVTEKQADGIVTLPLQKEGLHKAGLAYPGHTEILAERTGTKSYGMMLYANGLGVLHVTLHMALRTVFKHLTREAIGEKIHLLHDLLPRLNDRPARIAVAALNPHASDGGLFGDEEARIILPAVEEARQAGIAVTGPIPSDTLFVRARRGEFDGVVAMYHDQGHIALKLLGGLHAVNITLGLPIVRTSVAHGTAYDIAGQGIAEPTGLVEATRLAAKLACSMAGKLNL